MPPTEERTAEIEAEHGIVPSHGISIDLPAADAARPANIRHVSSPAYESPLRHHVRKQSSAKEVKETLHARSEYMNSQDDGAAIHRINQYAIKEEIGRGSFGAVHLAVDQHGAEYAVKEFSKSRLRKRAQSNILRRPHAAKRAGRLGSEGPFNAPLRRQTSAGIQDQEEGDNPLFLIREEIAVMKKLNHDNLVSLIEVLDDPNEDSLYMVLEMCKKGVVMKVGMDQKADPYDDESCRCWFRDLILGIEYLHAQGVVHRDIKPDNLLLTEDDVLKVVDFGVSEIFERHSEMMTAKSAGSPAFLPPELCVAKHGDISGTAADIWSMGVTLYCLRFGRIPFEQAGVLQLYESIKNDEIDLSGNKDCEDSFKDIMHRLLEKDPAKRIKMPELREHPWVTKNGNDPLLSEEENTANLVEPPTEEETNQAITSNLSNILVVMKAVQRFKTAIQHKRTPGMDTILGKDTRMVQPPLSIFTPVKPPLYHKTRSEDASNRRPVEQALATEGVHREVDPENFEKGILERQDTDIAYSPKTPVKRSSTKQSDEQGSPTTNNPKRDLHANPQEHMPHHAATAPIPIDHDGKGQARDPLSQHLYLGLGPGSSSRPPSPAAVSESPPAAETNIYETAYDLEIQRLRSLPGRSTTLFLTRRVSHKEEYRRDEELIRSLTHDEVKPKSGFAKMLEQARTKAAGADQPEQSQDESKDEEMKEGEASKPAHESMALANAAGVVRNMLSKKE